ncbi:DUF1566 domain-containing protein [Streptomyces sp. NPDC059787]|uniref:Lcl C-terminal domain-containing protein n=1 Tax=Streptomyces sp. NPDC059787 TaxID=3346947 RepID=UPI0036543843
MRAREALARRLLPFVYNVVGRALARHARVDHCVEEAVLEALRRLPRAGAERELRNGAARRALSAAVKPSAEQFGGQEPLVDFAESHCLRQHLSGERRELVHAGHWLDEDDRVVWSLWWLEAMGEMTRPDLMSVLGLSAADTETGVHRVLGHVATARAVVGALTVSRCDNLAWCTAEWDGRPSPEWRERIAAHVQQCADCFVLTVGRTAPDVLVADENLVPVPSSLVDSVVTALDQERQNRLTARHRAARADPTARRTTLLAAGLAAAMIGALGAAYTVVPDESGGAVEQAAVTSAGPSSPATVASSASPSSAPSSARPTTSKKAAPKKTAEASSPAERPPTATVRAGCGTALAGGWADWPMPGSANGVHAASYTDLGDGTVRDDVTCLVWQRTPAPDTYTFSEARSYCAGLDLGGRGWHVPSRIELMSLVDTTRSGPAIDTSAFPGTPPTFFWTSSAWAVPKTPLRAWIINFYEGLSSNAAYQSGSSAVRCVRGGGGDGRPSYRISAGQVTDLATGLTWQRATAPGTMSATGADDYCSALSLGGRTWRLPTSKELATLVDDGRVTPAIDLEAFPDTPRTGAYWSSSVFAPDRSQRWFLSYNDGITSHRPLAGAYVRCVS